MRSNKTNMLGKIARRARRSRTLYVKPYYGSTILKKWKVESIYSPTKIYYVRCNYKGEVNWDKTLAYTVEELIEKNNVKIWKPEDCGC